METRSTCGASRAITCSMSGAPCQSIQPLSTPPMRLPAPPARIRPLTLVRSATDVGHLDLVAAGRGGGADLGVAIVAGAPDVADGGGDAFVVEVGAYEHAQVVAVVGEEAGEEFA